MENIYRYSILNNIGLIIQYHENNLTLNGIKRLKSEIIEDKHYNPEYVFLVDVRRAKIKMTGDELFEYGIWTKEIMKLKGLMRLAILTNDPEQVAVSTIYTLNEKMLPLKHQVFSTLDAALDWLHVDISNQNVVEVEIDRIREK